MKPSNYAHGADIIGFLLDQKAQGYAAALVAVIKTDGGGVRAPGALMGVSETGVSAGYVSNGCVDADVVLNAVQAIERGEARRLVYGEGSPFIDVRLPCGGSLELLVLPHPDMRVLRQAGEALERREAISLRLNEDGLSIAAVGFEQTHLDGEDLNLRLAPKLRIRIAGRGAEPLALARLAAASDLLTLVQSPDAENLDAARALGLQAVALETPDTPPEIRDDAWSAVALMFHDHDWETKLLEQALKGPAFYIGALGSRKTHAKRCEALRALGVSEADLARLKGPIGLIPHARDATRLAVSTLAEIMQASEP